MMSYMPPASDGSNTSNPVNSRFRAFHKTRFQHPPTPIPLPPNDSHDAPLEKNHRFVRQFHGPGVERQSKPWQFAYGSEASYGGQGRERGGRLRMAAENKTSAEVRKLKWQQHEAETDIQTHQEEKSKRHLERTREKKKDLEMLQSYQPWGKPAPGAPRLSPSGGTDTRRQKLDTEQASNAGSHDNDGRSSTPPYDPFGRPGAGAPLRSTSGKVVASLRADPGTRFQQQLKREVDGPLRYKNGSGQGERGWGAGQGIVNPELRRTDSEKVRRMEEREKQLVYARKLEQQRMEALERRANEKAMNKAAGPVYHPWGQDRPDRDESGKVQGRKRVITKGNVGGEPKFSPEFTGLAFQMGRQGGGGAPLRDSNGRIRTKRSTNDVNLGQTEECFDPWGKPGSGAPLRNTEGQTMAALYGKCYREQQGTREPLAEAIHQSQEAKEQEARKTLKGHGLEVATWLRAGVVGQPKRNPHSGDIIGSSRSTSDVTAKRLDIRPGGGAEGGGTGGGGAGRGVYQLPRTDAGKGCYTDLQRQAEERQRQRRSRREGGSQQQRTTWTWGGDDELGSSEGSSGSHQRQREYCQELRRMMDRREEERKGAREERILREREHAEAFNRQWGKPGAGAPRLNQLGQIDTTTKNFVSMPETQVYTGKHFRRA